MAQLGARLNGIEKVVGSNPTGSTLTKEYPDGFIRVPKKTKTEVLGHLPESWSHRLRAPAKVPAECLPNWEKAELVCSSIKEGCVGENE